MRGQIRTSVEIGSETAEVRRSTHPLDALSEFMRNAVMHRAYEATNTPVHLSWFDDRVEIVSPGGPFGDVERNRSANRESSATETPISPPRCIAECPEGLIARPGTSQLPPPTPALCRLLLRLKEGIHPAP